MCADEAQNTRPCSAMDTVNTGLLSSPEAGPLSTYQSQIGTGGVARAAEAQYHPILTQTGQEPPQQALPVPGKSTTPPISNTSIQV